MAKKTSYLFKIASHPQEFEQIFRLNHETFAEEIPQHDRNEQGVLIDSFHDQNTYIIALKDHQVIGMISLADKRPFSLDKKLGDIGIYLSDIVNVNKLCEIRLLSIRKEYRKTKVFVGLLRLLHHVFIEKGYDGAVISGILREEKLYKHIGFIPFAHQVGSHGAIYQPMYLLKDRILLSEKVLPATVSFLPGPVLVTDNVLDAFCRQGFSHRDNLFMEMMERVQTRLTDLTKAKYVQVMLGTGTLANDAVAAQLSLLNGKGLILSNGEFGERLAQRAARFQLHCQVLKKEWGEPFSEEELRTALNGGVEWIWYVHCETSTGTVIPIEHITKLIGDKPIKQAVDCISTIGALPVSLKNVYLATAVSGKGIESVSGLALVFHNHAVKPNEQLPPYLDLGLYHSHNSVPYTHSSPLLAALEQALTKDFTKKFSDVADWFAYTYKRLTDAKFYVLPAANLHCSPILTVCLDPALSSVMIGDWMKKQGFHLHYQSSYLQERNWIQISMLANVSIENTEAMLQIFFSICSYLQQLLDDNREALAN
ncbi:aminotransferase class V-fold PLP-dependent enzyme [Bacillus sp. Au-Bac7]|uniref:aminotransferase class V-fold PLP-dependent enzyme n=1 Tax=Bacillus sp. Au-Bac7 TaxID=2906458 RepID=UPI001E4E60F8|nr:aminotransferase class V-fold PLP-dependent enzyme [Bacillus sp. Au-Bac7]MCE4047822.1 aminotransferase class V-fold PLP-dependent enzyme [Bacillus sp. Au-Bac7]